MSTSFSSAFRTHLSKRVMLPGLLAVSAVLAGCGEMADTAGDPTTPAGREWPVAGGDYANTRFSTLDEINKGNVGELGGAWFHAFDRENSRGTPIVAGGRMFVTASQSVRALDPETGELLWSYEPEEGAVGTKGVAVGDGKVFAPMSGARVAALDEATGDLLWIGRVGDDPPIKGQQISAPPTYADGVLISGMANGDFGLRGRIVGLNAETGEKQWTFHVVPYEGHEGHETWPQDHEDWKPGGGGVWMTPAVDPELGLTYLGVGNPIPQFGGELRAGDNLFTDTVVALDIQTGELKWHYQIVHHDIWEADLGTPLILYDAEVDGQMRKGLAAISTYGHMFLLDRATGEPIWPVEERPVPQNARLHTSPTQPFPVDAGNMGPDCMPERLIPEGFVGLCIYEPVDVDMPNGMYPILTTRAAPMAYNPESHKFYATGAIWPRWLKRPEDPKYFLSNPTIPGIKYEGLLAAFDGATNQIDWEKNVPYRTQQNGSGFLATASGLLFNGNTDGLLEAIDAETGERIWAFQTGADVNHPVSSYEAGGAQHIAVVASAGVWAFKRGGEIGEREAPPVPPEGAGFRGRIVPADEIVIAPMVPDTGLEFVRYARDEYAFLPQRTRIGAGEELTWKNEGEETHTITAEDGSWTTGPVAPGESVTITIDTPGTYVYQCEQHLWSYGELTVEE